MMRKRGAKKRAEETLADFEAGPTDRATITKNGEKIYREVSTSAN